MISGQIPTLVLLKILEEIPGQTKSPITKTGKSYLKDLEIVGTETQPVLFSSKINQIEDSVNLGKEAEVNAIQIHNRFIISQIKSGILLIDQQSAYERIFYEKYLKEISQQKGISQQILFPKTVSLSAIDYALSFEIIDMIRNIGFNVEEFGQNTYIINGVPSQFLEEDEAELFKSLIEQYKINENNQKQIKRLWLKL